MQVVFARRADGEEEMLLFELDPTAPNEVHSRGRYRIPSDGESARERRTLTDAKFW